MAITAACGPHCGIRANAEDTVTREGHCGCDELCHAGSPPPGTVTSRAGQPPGDVPPGASGVPMCARWYEAAGDRRPWHPHGGPAAASLTYLHSRGRGRGRPLLT